MSFQMAGKPGGRCQQLLIHRAVLAKNRELRHSWMLVCQAKRQGSCEALSLSSCRSASLPHTQAEKTLEVSRSSPCSRVLTLSALFSPSHLHNSHITTRLSLIYTSSPLTPSLSDSLAAVFLLSFFFLFYCPPYFPPHGWQLVLLQLYSHLLPVPLTLWHRFYVFLTFPSRARVSCSNTVLLENVISRGREQTVLCKRTE